MGESSGIPILKIATLGGLSIQRGGRPVDGISSTKVQALLVYLARTARPHAREVLAELLWFERAPDRALGNLRNVLHGLRQNLGPYVNVTRETVAINPDHVWLDVTELTTELAILERPNRATSPAEIDAVTRALDLYRGEFLLGFPTGDSRGFEDWLSLERERLHRRVLDALGQAVDWHLVHGQYAAGANQAARLLQLDPLMEAAHQQLMRLLAYSGHRQAALNQYETYGRTLEAELGIEPEPETAALFEAIQTGTLEVPEPLPLPAAGQMPGGTVTFLFTDIQGSTALLDQLKDQYVDLLAQHRDLIRTALASWKGEEVDSQGDSLFCSFHRAADAAAAAVEIQRALAAHDWPQGVEVRVRMGLHTGEPWLVKEGYVGMDVHRAARIGDAGHGGQVLLSESTTALVREELPEGISLLDLGRHRLEDVRRPEHIHQLVIPELGSDFPPLQSLETVTAPVVEGELRPAGRTPREVGPSPYRGLAAFREADADFFYGREEFTDELVAAIARQPLTAVVVGASGSGKSSAVFAGLLPRLRAEEGWLALELRPGAQPFHALTSALIPLLEPELGETARLIEGERLAAAMQAGEVSLFRAVSRALERDPAVERLLLIADQFEELYTLCTDSQLREAFTDELLAAVEAASKSQPSPLVLLLTLRADFMGQAMGHRPFSDALQDSALLLGPMNRPELRSAIEKPAEKQGAAFETGLVERILDDIGQEPGNLPLLEFALTLLWERMDQGWLTHAAYESIGRVEGALSQYAEEVFQALNEAGQEGARRVFVQLIQPGEGTEDTRRVATRAEISRGHWRLIQHLADKRLVVTGQGERGVETVEVVHEALIRSWDRLRRWIDEDRAFRSWQEGLRSAIRVWETSERDQGALLRGAPLVEAESWLDERGDELGGAESTIIDASVANREQRQAVRERRRRWILSGLASGLVVALILMAFAFSQRSVAQRNEAIAGDNAARAQAEAVARATQQAVAEQEAEARATQQALAEAEQLRAENEADARATAEAIAVEERQAAVEQAALTTSRELALAAINNLDIDPELSILLALQALSVVNTVEAEESLHRAVNASRVQLLLAGHTDEVAGIDFSPDGRFIATSSLDQTARIWDAVTGDELHVLGGHTEFVGDVAFSPDSSLLATASDDDTVKIWAADSGEEKLELTGHEGSIWGVAFSPDGARLATADVDGMVKIWDVESGQELLTFTGHPEQISDIHFSPDGTRLVTASGSAKVWDAASGDELVVLSGHTDYVFSAKFDAEGSRIATGSRDGTARVWDVATGQEIISFTGHASEIWGVEFSPDGALLATASADGTAKLWDLASGQEMLTLAGHDDRVWGLTFGPDGTRLVTSSIDHTARVWDIQTSREWLTVATNQFFTDVAFSRDGARIAASGAAGSITVWDSTTGEEAQNLPGHSDWIGGIVFSPDGEKLASASDDLTAKVWDIETGSELLTLEGHADWVNNVALSPDRAHIATIGNEGMLKLWSLADGQEQWSFLHDDSLWGVDFSHDSSLVAVGGKGDTIWIHETQQGEILSELTGHTDTVKEVVFDPDGRHLASASWDGVLKIWEFHTTNELLSLQAHSSLIVRIAFSPDGKSIATVSADGTAKVWDVGSGRKLLTFNDHTETVTGVDFSPDGTYLATSSFDGTVRVYVLPLDKLIELARSRVTRSLTTEECQQYLHMETCPARE